VLLVERPGGGTRVVVSLPHRLAPVTDSALPVEVPEIPYAASLPGR
jgi:hypothetical protein